MGRRPSASAEAPSQGWTELATGDDPASTSVPRTAPSEGDQHVHNNCITCEKLYSSVDLQRVEL
jgi:hypothetical protein